MKKPPPPSRLNQQEPPYQSPPRPPPQQEPPYHTQPPPPLHQQENFMSLVQRPNYTSAAFDDSPAMEMYAELERTKPRLGFASGVETTDHQNRDKQPPNLSPTSSSLWRELSCTFSPQELEFLNSLFSSPSTSAIPHCDGGALKRPRFDLGHEDRGTPHSVNDTRTIGSDYDMYLRRVRTPSLPSEGVGRVNGVGGMGRPGGDNLYMPGRGGVFPPDFGRRNGTRASGFGQQDLAGRPSRELLRLPPDASNTLFVKGLPSDCSMREVAHIFRPFSGYKEVRLVTKDSKHRNGDPIIVLCFVDFENPACAAIARNALQGYQMDEEEPDSKSLQIQFSRNPGPRRGQRGGRK